MKSWLLFALAIVSLLSGCDISGLYDYYVPEIIYPSKEDNHEYHLQSGNSFQYFGTEVETIVYEDSAIITGEMEYPVIDGVPYLRQEASSSLLYDETDGEYQVMEMTDRAPIATRKGF